MTVDKKWCIVLALKQSKMPCHIENIRIRAGLKSWEGTKAMLLELMVEGRIQGWKTTKSWIFWREDEEDGGSK